MPMLDFVTHRLTNGLTLTLTHLPSLRRSAAFLWVRCGAAYEEESEYGVAHFLEHLCFKGSDHLAPGEFDRRIARLGGSDNAFTSYDYTAYFVELPHEHLGEALALLCEITLRAKIPQDYFEEEKGVVLEEIKMHRDLPLSWLEDQHQKTLLGGTPWAHPILGYEKTLAPLTPEQVRSFHRCHYTAPRLTLSVAGPGSPEEVLELAEESFGRVELAPTWQPEPQADFSSLSKVEATLHPKPVQATYLLLSTLDPTPPSLSRMVKLGFLTEILAGSFSSRLNQELVEKSQLATEVSLDRSVHPPGSVLTLTLITDQTEKTPRLVERALKVLGEVAREGVREEELERVRKGELASLAFARESASTMASRVGWWKLIHNLRSLEDLIDLVGSVTTDEIGELAAELFSPRRSWVLTGLYPQGERMPQVELDLSPLHASTSSTSRQPTSPDQWEVELENGLKVIYRHAPGTQSVAISLGTSSGLPHEPIPGLTTLMANTILKGTEEKSAVEISQIFEQMGTSVSCTAGTHHTVLSTRTMLGDLPRALSTLAEILSGATFPPAEVEKERWEMEAERRQRLDSSLSVGLRKLRELAFAGYRLGRDPLGEEESLARITPNELRAWANNLFQPDGLRLVMVGGEPDGEAVLAEAGEVLSQLELGVATLRPSPEPDPPDELGKRYHHETFQREQLMIALAVPACPLDHPDYPRWKLLASYLGDHMNSRYFRILRSEQSLAYSVWGNLIADRRVGIFYGAILTSREKGEVALCGLAGELAKAVAGELEEDYLTEARDHIVESLRVAFESNPAKAGMMEGLMAQGLPLDFYERLREEVARLDPDQMRQFLAGMRLDDFLVVSVGPSPIEGACDLVWEELSRTL